MAQKSASVWLVGPQTGNWAHTLRSRATNTLKAADVLHAPLGLLANFAPTADGAREVVEWRKVVVRGGEGGILSRCWYRLSAGKTVCYLNIGKFVWLAAHFGRQTEGWNNRQRWIKWEKGWAENYSYASWYSAPDVAFNTFATFVIEYDKSKATQPRDTEPKPKRKWLEHSFLSNYTHNKLSFAGQLNGIKFTQMRAGMSPKSRLSSKPNKSQFLPRERNQITLNSRKDAKGPMKRNQKISIWHNIMNYVRWRAWPICAFRWPTRAALKFMNTFIANYCKDPDTFPANTCIHEQDRRVGNEGQKSQVTAANKINFGLRLAGFFVGWPCQKFFFLPAHINW